jgi:adenine nucleotide transporter 17
MLLQSINRHTEEQMQYTGVWHAIQTMARSEGLGAFYKGMRVKLLQTVLAAALLMVLKEEIFATTRAVLQPAPRLATVPASALQVTARAARQYSR